MEIPKWLGYDLIRETLLYVATTVVMIGVLISFFINQQQSQVSFFEEIRSHHKMLMQFTCEHISKTDQLENDHICVILSGENSATINITQDQDGNVVYTINTNTPRGK